MFWVRFRSSVILMGLTLFTVILGGNVLFAAVLGISLIGLSELYRVLQMEKTPLAWIGYATCIAYDALLLFGKASYGMGLIVASFLLLMTVYVLTFPNYTSEQALMAFFGLFYVGIMLSYLYRTRMLSDGAIVVWLIFIGAWGSDTCAYCVGKLIGRHKATPKLSPHKTWEGCIGGVAGAALLGFLYATVFQGRITGVTHPQTAYALICAAAAVISQFGDLTASALKRNYKIKDYGTLIPGHGGILDRFDSIIFTAPIVFYLAEWF